MRTLVILLGLSLLIPMAMASEFMGQPRDSKHAITVTPKYTMTQEETKLTKPSTVKNQYTTTGYGTALRYEYGFTKDLGAALESEYDNYTYENTERSSGAKDKTYKKTGWNDIYLKGQYLYALSAMDTFIGLNVGYSPQKASTENNFSGRHSVEPTLGVEYILSPIIIGGQAGYKYNLKGKYRIANDPADWNITGAHRGRIGVFGEYPGSNWLAGLNVEYQMISKSSVDYTITDPTTKIATTYANDTASFGQLKIKGYGVYTVMGNLDFVPALTGVMRLDDNNISKISVKTGTLTATSDYIESKNSSSYIAELGLRYTF